MFKKIVIGRNTDNDNFSAAVVGIFTTFICVCINNNRIYTNNNSIYNNNYTILLIIINHFQQLHRNCPVGIFFVFYH